jgi:hypothetical protein
MNLIKEGILADTQRHEVFFFCVDFCRGDGFGL